MRRAAKIGCHWVAWNAMVLAVQYTSGMLYWYACTAPPWDLEHVWRALVLTWSPSMGCLLLNQAQFFTQNIYLYNGLILLVAGLHEVVRAVVEASPPPKPAEEKSTAWLWPWAWTWPGVGEGG